VILVRNFQQSTVNHQQQRKRGLAETSEWSDTSGASLNNTMSPRVISLVKNEFTSPFGWVPTGISVLVLLSGPLYAQQSGFQPDGTPIYQAVPYNPNAPVPPAAPGQTMPTAPYAPGTYAPGSAQALPPVPTAPGQATVPGTAPGMAPAANPAYPELVYPPVYSPETQAKPPRAVPVPESKRKFGLFKRKDKEKESSAPRYPSESDTARVYPEPSTANQPGMQPRPGTGGTYPSTDPYATTGTAPTGDMQARPGFDPRYPVYTNPQAGTDPYVTGAPGASTPSGMQPRTGFDPRYPVSSGTQPSATMPPLPDTRTAPQAPPEMASNFPGNGTVPPAAPYQAPDPGTLAQAPAGPAMPPSDPAPIFRRETMNEPTPPASTPPPTGAGAPSNAPIFRNGSGTNAAAPTPPPARTETAGTSSPGSASNAGTGPGKWESAPGLGNPPSSAPSSTAANPPGTLPPARNQTPPPAPEPEFASLPYAKPVPGKVGFVTVASYAGEIDVRGIAPGTPVEIPDPSDSAKTIQFRVP
jgi:hypothetical protein